MGRNTGFLRAVLRSIPNLVFFTIALFCFRMTLDRYDYIASETMLDFEFESEGPKGKIRKIIRFGLQHSSGITFCNLGFGDINAKTGTIEDLAISNNNDKDKISQRWQRLC